MLNSLSTASRCEVSWELFQLGACSLARGQAFEPEQCSRRAKLVRCSPGKASRASARGVFILRLAAGKGRGPSVAWRDRARFLGNRASLRCGEDEAITLRIKKAAELFQSKSPSKIFLFAKASLGMLGARPFRCT